MFRLIVQVDFILKTSKLFLSVKSVNPSHTFTNVYKKDINLSFKTFIHGMVVIITPNYINRNLKALSTLDNLRPNGSYFEINENIKDLPMGNGLLTERQLRPLTSLEPEIQRQV